VTLAVAFAALTAYFAFTVGLGAVASAYLAYTVVTTQTYFWLANLGPVGWTIAAVIAIIAIAGVDVGSELADFEDSVKEFGSDIDDAIFGEDGLLGGLF
jgi:glyoxylate carboligase